MESEHLGLLTEKNEHCSICQVVPTLVQMDQRPCISKPSLSRVQPRFPGVTGLSLVVRMIRRFPADYKEKFVERPCLCHFHAPKSVMMKLPY